MIFTLKFHAEIYSFLFCLVNFTLDLQRNENENINAKAELIE